MRIWGHRQREAIIKVALLHLQPLTLDAMSSRMTVNQVKRKPHIAMASTRGKAIFITVKRSTNKLQGLFGNSLRRTCLEAGAMAQRLQVLAALAQVLGFYS